MRVVRPVLSFVLVLSSSLQVSSQQSAPAPIRDAQALALLSKCAAAMSSSAQIADVSASGTLTDSLDSDAARPISLKVKGSNQVREEITYPDRTDSSVVSQGQGWSVSRGASQAMPNWSARFQRADYFPAIICATEAARTDTAIAYVGLEKLADSTVHHITISAAPLGKSKDFDDFESQISQFHLYLDPITMLPVATSHLVFSPATPVNSSVWRSFYSDYRPVSGVLMPFHIECSVSGQKILAIQFSQVLVNAGVSDAEFQKN